MSEIKKTNNKLIQSSTKKPTYKKNFFKKKFKKTVPYTKTNNKTFNQKNIIKSKSYLQNITKKSSRITKKKCVPKSASALLLIKKTIKRNFKKKLVSKWKKLIVSQKKYKKNFLFKKKFLLRIVSKRKYSFNKHQNVFFCPSNFFLKCPILYSSSIKRRADFSKNNLINIYFLKKSTKNLNSSIIKNFCFDHQNILKLRQLIVLLLELNFFGIKNLIDLLFLTLTKEFVFFKNEMSMNLLLINQNLIFQNIIKNHKIFLSFVKNYKFFHKKKKNDIQKEKKPKKTNKGLSTASLFKKKKLLVRSFFSKLIKINTKNGHKRRSYKIFLTALKTARTRLPLKKLSNFKILCKIMNKLNPLFTIRKHNIGRRTFWIPLPLLAKKKIAATARLFLQGVKKRPEISFRKKLVEEFKDFFFKNKNPYSMRLRQEKIKFALENKQNLRLLKPRRRWWK